MTIIEMIEQGNFVSLAIMLVIIAGILAMVFFFHRELKRAHGETEKKNEQAVGSVTFNTRQSGNSAITAAISAAVNEYRKNN